MRKRVIGTLILMEMRVLQRGRMQRTVETTKKTTMGLRVTEKGKAVKREARIEHHQLSPLKNMSSFFSLDCC